MRQEMTVKQGRNRDAERGIALLAVVAVLVLLTIIATPFLVTMKDGADRGKALLANCESGLEAENVFQVATLHLGASHDALERKNKDEKLQTLYATPDWDTLEEIQIPASVLSAAGGDPESGRIWGVTVEDESGKINVNNAPYTVLGHFFGMSLLAAPLDQDATEAELSYPGNLPARDGVVRLGDEVVKYDRLEGTTLRGLERGYMAGFAAGNGPARKHSQGEVVVNEIAFQISAYPILSRRGKVGDELRTWYSPYRNLYEIRRISDLRVAALPAEAWEKAADCLTVSSRGLTGQLWSDSQTLRTPVKAGEDGHKAKLHVDNPYRFGLGTVVRVTDGTNTDYGIVYGVGGGSRVEIVPEFQHDYDASITRVESLVRTPVNVNTASREVLTALHSGIGRHGQKPLAPDQARLVADRLIKEREAKFEDPLRGQKATAPGIRSLKQYGQILRKMVEEGVLQDEEATACELNSLNPADTAPGRLAVGSVPVAFRSCDVFTVTARAVVLDTAGRELGRREFRRVVDVAPQGPGVFELAGQADLDENLRVVNAKHFTTFPQNVDDEETGIYPPSRFNAFFRGDRWPSRDRLDQHASVRLAASRPIYGPEVPSAEHWDDSDYPEGYYMEEGEATPFGTQDGRVSIRTDDGLMEPFSGSLWFKPYWGGRRTAYVLDTGEAEDENRISLYYDGSRREMALRVKDASLQEVAAEIRYPFDQSSWEDDRWYHLQFSVSGSGPGEMSMLVDGMCRGKPTLLTYLSSSVDPVAPLTTLAVEDASSFPQSGALLIRGSNGTEVMEYSARSEKAFTIRKRFARLNRADTTDDPNQATTRAFDAGDLVTLYGYSIPTASAIPEGNGTLASALGPFTALCLVGPSDESGLAQFPNQAGGGTTGGGGTPTIPPVAFGWRGDTIQIPFDQIAPWGKSPGDQAASDALSDRGYALLACGDHRGALLAPDGERIFDAELVAYEKSGGSVTIRRRPEPTASLRSTGGSSSIDKKSGNLNLSFVPRHTYGAADDPMTAYVKLRNINNGRIYADEAFDEAGIVSVLIPLSIEVAGGDEDMFLDPERDATRRPRSHYVQIGVDGDTEWVRFDDAVQENSVSGNLLLVRDRSAYRTVSLFRTWIGEIAVTATPPGGGDPPGGGGDPPGGGGGGGGDTPPPPPPEDDGTGGGGDEPPTPPTPDPGPGEDDGTGGTPDTPPVPPDPGTGPGEDDGTGGTPDTPPTPDPDTPPGEDDGTGGTPDTPPTPPEDPGGGEDDGTGGDPDTPPDEPPPPDDGGGDPDPPPDDGGGTTDPDPDLPPDTGDGTTTGGGGPGTAIPFPVHRIARYLDMRATATTNDPMDPADDDRPIYVADIPARGVHATGAQVLPVFLVAFPGTEYDPQGNGIYDPEAGLDDILTAPLGNGSSGGGATAGGSSSTSSPAGSGGGSGSVTENLWKPGDTGDDTEPGSSNIDGRFIQPGPGEDDVVTLAQGGPEGEKETQVVNWSFRQWDWNRAMTQRRSWTFVAFKEPASRTYERNNRDFGPADVNSFLQGNLGDRRSFTRLVKSPSGELPVRVAENIHVGADYNGGNFSPAVVDEAHFTSPRTASTLVHRRHWFVGAGAAPGAPGKGIAAGDVNIPIHALLAFQVQTYAEGTRTTGGVARIGDELIGYAGFDESSQTLTNCERGILGTEARSHAYGSPVVPVFGIPVARLEEGIGETSSEISLASAAGFPIWGGFVRIGDEVLGYTRVDGNVLKMPTAVSRREDTGWSSTAGSDASKGLLRARYGSKAAAHESQSMVYLLPHRYPDYSCESADNPQLAWYTVSREVQGAVWKRVSWDERLRDKNGIRVLVRFEGGPDWDTEKLVRVGTDPLPESDRTGWIYEVRNPRELNLLNVQSDSIECRVFFNFEEGAWDPTAASAPDSWKETPWMKAFRIEYTAPTGVVTTEDLR